MKNRGVKEKEINNKLDILTDEIEFVEKNNYWKNIEILNYLLLSMKEVLPELKEPFLWKDYVIEYNSHLKEILNKVETNIAEIKGEAKSFFEIKVKRNTIRGKPQ